MDDQERTGLRKLADEVISLNLDGLDIGQLERRLAVIKSLQELQEPLPQAAGCGTFKCNDFSEKPS